MKIKTLEDKILRITTEAKEQAKLDGFTITDTLNSLKIARQRYQEAEAKLEKIYLLCRR